MSYTGKERTELLSPQSRIDKSSSKFNRKQQPSKLQRRKLDAVLQPSDRICFISPVRTVTHLPLASPKDNCQLQISSIVTSPPPTERTSNPPPLNDSILSLYDELASQQESKYTRDLHFYRSQVQKLYDELANYKQLTDVLQKQKENAQQMESFMCEREEFIGTLAQENHRLEEQVRELKMQCEDKDRELEDTEKQYQKKLENMQEERNRYKAEIDFMITLNLELNQTIAKSKQQRSARKKQQAQNSLSKSKSTATLSRQHSERGFTLQRVQQIEQPSTRIRHKSPEKHNEMLKEIGDFVCRSMDESTMLRTMLQPIELPNQNQKMLASLRQSKKYSQIEIDILKKMKLQAQAKNKKLGLENRKLKERVRQLEILFKKKPTMDSDQSWDQSLEFSLSPKKER